MDASQGPIYSPDGRWMWSGHEWVPAPPPAPSTPPIAVPPGWTSTPPRTSTSSEWAGPIAGGVAAAIFWILGASVQNDPDLARVGGFLIFLAVVLTVGAGLAMARVFRTVRCTQCDQRVSRAARLCPKCRSTL